MKPLTWAVFLKNHFLINKIIVQCLKHIMEETGKDPQLEKPIKGNSFADIVNKLRGEFQHGVQNEFIWPIFSLIATLKPVHLLVTGNRAQIEKGDKVLEVGSGYPFYKVYSNKVGEDGVFVSLDINPNLQKRSKKFGYWMDRILKRKKHDNLVTADAGKLPFTDSSFDVVIASNFTGGTKEYIREAYRVLKPGGRLVTAFIEPLIYPRESKRNAKACKEAGFIDVKMRPGMPGVLGGSIMVPPMRTTTIEGDLIESLIFIGISWNWDVVAKKPESLQKDLNSSITISGT